jgi:hypothetical protein
VLNPTVSDERRSHEDCRRPGFVHIPLLELVAERVDVELPRGLEVQRGEDDPLANTQNAELSDTHGLLAFDVVWLVVVLTESSAVLFPGGTLPLRQECTSSRTIYLSTPATERGSRTVDCLCTYSLRGMPPSPAACHSCPLSPSTATTAMISQRQPEKTTCCGSIYPRKPIVRQQLIPRAAAEAANSQRRPLTRDSRCKDTTV